MCCKISCAYDVLKHRVGLTCRTIGEIWIAGIGSRIGSNCLSPIGFEWCEISRVALTLIVRSYRLYRKSKRIRQRLPCQPSNRSLRWVNRHQYLLYGHIHGRSELQLASDCFEVGSCRRRYRAWMGAALRNLGRHNPIHHLGWINRRACEQILVIDVAAQPTPPLNLIRTLVQFRHLASATREERVFQPFERKS